VGQRPPQGAHSTVRLTLQFQRDAYTHVTLHLLDGEPRVVRCPRYGGGYQPRAQLPARACDASLLIGRQRRVKSSRIYWIIWRVLCEVAQRNGGGRAQVGDLIEAGLS
jgi:hypothetical protein